MGGVSFSRLRRWLQAPQTTRHQLQPQQSTRSRYRCLTRCPNRRSEVDELDFGGIDESREEAAACAGEALDGVGSEETSGALACLACQVLAPQQVADAFRRGGSGVDDVDARAYGGADGADEHREVGAT